MIDSGSLIADFQTAGSKHDVTFYVNLLSLL